MKSGNSIFVLIGLVVVGVLWYLQKKNTSADTRRKPAGTPVTDSEGREIINPATGRTIVQPGSATQVAPGTQVSSETGFTPQPFHTIINSVSGGSVSDASGYNPPERVRESVSRVVKPRNEVAPQYSGPSTTPIVNDSVVDSVSSADAVANRLYLEKRRIYQ